MQRTVEEKTELFETMPIHHAAMTLIIPTVISQLVMLVYNMADTWYIGQTGDPYQVAAVTVTYPIFMMMNALANLFGIGGSSLVSRMLGGGEQKKTGGIAAFSLWAAGGVTFCYSLICLLFDRQFLALLGTDAGTLPYAQNYLLIGGLPTVLNMVLANIVRAQGDARISSIGISLGGVLNMVMDPVFIFLMGMGVAGAALSTCLSNAVSLLFLLIHVIRSRESSLLKIPLFPQHTERSRRVEIYSIGTPAALQILLAAVSNAVLLRFMSAYPVAAISGMGVMQKVESIPFQAIMGISDGVLPLVAYNFASGNRERMNQAVRFALTRGIACAFACFLLYEAAAPWIVRFFITDAQSIVYGFSNVFTKDNGKRAVYTVTAGTATDSQTYKIVVLRRLDLSMIGCYLPSDTDMAKNLISEFDSAGITRDYDVTVGENTESVKVSAKAFNDKWYGLTVNGQAVSGSNAIEIPLDGSETRITFQMKEDGTYQDPAYQDITYTSTGTYTITVHKKAKSSITFTTDPSDAVVSVYDSKGERVEPSKDADVYDSLYYGDEYTWNVSRHGYISRREKFTVGEETEIQVKLEQQTATQPEITDNDWSSYRNSETNNGITNTSTPTSKDTTVQKWSLHLDAKGWDAALTPPLILGGYLYVASGQFIYKIDKNTGDIVQTSEQMHGNMQYAMIPLAYAEGMLFAQIGGGQIQALSATSLKSLWISESLGGQTLSPITYKDGYIYTGTWTSDTTPGSYFCLSVTDEDPSKGDEIKYCTWKYNHKGGFYWTGAYASENYLVFGSDDGAGDAYTSILYSVNTHTGQLIDKRTDMIGDIRSTIVYNNGYVYFTTKGGYLYRVAMNADGTFGAVASYNLGGAATSTPVVYKGRIYVGVCGNGGQYNADGGHHFDVLTESASGLSLAYKVSIPGYPQAAPLLSTAYENQDFNGDGKADGRVYLYFTYNAKPGGIYMLTDEPGQTSGKPEELFRPVLAQQEYCISPICVDRDGTLYYKNDSCYLMALETNGAYLDSVSAEADTGRVSWEKAFQRSEKEHTLRVAENATKVTLTFKAPAGCTLTVNGKASNGTYVADVRSGQADVTVKTTLNGKSRDYIFHLTSGLGNSSLANLVVSTSNTFTDTSKYLTLSPVFDSTKTSYTVSYLADKEENKEKFLRLYVEPSDGDATVTVQKVKGVEKVSMPVVANGKTKRVNVYWETDASEAQVKITVTAAGSGKTDYLLTIQRKEIVPTPTPTEVPEVFGPWKTISAATVFSPAVQMRTSNKGRKEKRTVGKKLTPTIKVTATSIKLKVKQSTSKIKVSGLAKGDSVKSWTSSNKKIVSVNSKGTMKGLKAGKAKVTITLASGKKQVISVTVQKTTVRTTKITGLKSSVTVARNKKLALKPVISPITSQEKVTYSSSNKKIATVSSSGVITGKKKGTAYITVKSGKIRKKVKVVVK